MEIIWTLDGDETSWSSWADNMADAPASPLMQELITLNKNSYHGWAVDIGCGTGRAFLPLVEAGYRVVGLDPTANGIWLSQQRVNQNHINAYPVLASAARSPLPTKSISLVFAISSLFHLSHVELASALQEIYRILLPGGKAFLHFLDLEDWRHTLAKEIHQEEVPVPSYQAVVTCFCSQGKIQEWIMLTGLKLISLELRTSSSEAGQQRNWLALCEKEVL
ncbi:MAG TPA: class I SAM-dependent methyltransferase [Anaerolineales bacterium]|nr:class I SAM-dependent methyltransferase [Anaerolineales bacterium]